MKKTAILLVIMIVLVSFLLAACNKPDKGTQTADTVTTQPGQNEKINPQTNKPYSKPPKKLFSDNITGLDI